MSTPLPWNTPPFTRLEILLVAGLLVLGASFRSQIDNSGSDGRVWTRNDEPIYLPRIVEGIRGRIAPDRFINPSVTIHLNQTLMRVVGGVLVLKGDYPDRFAFHKAMRKDPALVLLVGRALAATFGTLSILLLHLIGRRLNGPRTGIVAAAALAVDYIHCERSVILGNETTMVFLVLLAFLLMLRHIDRPTATRHLAAGLALGLAISTKYNALLHVLTFVVATGIAWRARELETSWAAPRYWLGFAAIPGAFFAGSPFALINFRDFVRDFRLQASYLGEGWSRSHLERGERGWTSFVLGFADRNQGTAFAICIAVGVAVLLWRLGVRRDRLAALLLTATVPGYLYLGSGVFSVMRFYLPIIPFLLVIGALIADALAAAVESRIPTRFASPAAESRRHWLTTAAVATLLIAPGAGRSLERQRLLHGGVDPRSDLQRIADESFGASDGLATLAYPPMLDIFDWRPGAVPLVELLAMSPDLDALKRELATRQITFVVLTVYSNEFEQIEKLDARFNDRRMASCRYWSELVTLLMSRPDRRAIPTRDGRLTLCIFPVSR